MQLGDDGGILIIALATGRGLVAKESEPVCDWLARRFFQSREFHLMKGSVQQAAAGGCSLRVEVEVGGTTAQHFSSSICAEKNALIKKKARISSTFLSTNKQNVHSLYVGCYFTASPLAA